MSCVYCEEKSDDGCNFDCGHYLCGKCYKNDEIFEEYIFDIRGKSFCINCLFTDRQLEKENEKLKEENKKLKERIKELKEKINI